MTQTAVCRIIERQESPVCLCGEWWRDLVLPQMVGNASKPADAERQAMSTHQRVYAHDESERLSDASARPLVA